MWDKLQTHGDRRNDAEVLAIAGAFIKCFCKFFNA